MQLEGASLSHLVDTVAIYSLSTVKEGRGRGIGTALMYRCMTASAEAGYRHMLLTSTPKARYALLYDVLVSSTSVARGLHALMIVSTLKARHGSYLMCF